MRHTVLLILLSNFSIYCFSQSRSTDGWIIMTGAGHRNKWLQIAPGKLGPNALPVPDMDYAIVDELNTIETGIHYHYMPGDVAVNSFLSFYISVVPEKVAVELWGVPREAFHMTNEIRDERQIFWDDPGWLTQQGDLWVSTYIQIVKDKKFPDFSINYTFSTTTGLSSHGRYCDAPIHYCYTAFGKNIEVSCPVIDEIRISAMGGFYVWQTNKAEMSQDEGPLIELGVRFRKGKLFLYNELGGYFGFGAYGFLNVPEYNDPVLYKGKIEKTGKRWSCNFEYRYGIHDYHYQTFMFGLGYKFSVRKGE